MKLFFALIALSIFASPYVAQAKQSSANCPPVVSEPKQLICQTEVSYLGEKISKKISIDLKPGNYKEWNGKAEIAFPGVSNPDNAPNTLEAVVITETHGNSETCPEQQTFEIGVDILGYKLSSAGRTTSLSIDDGFGKPSFTLQMNCSAK